MEVLLSYQNHDDDRLGGRFDAECMRVVGAAERDGFTTAVAGPEVTDRLRKAVTRGRHPGLRVWVSVNDKVYDVTDPAAEVQLVLRGCRVNESEVRHDWFGKAVS